MVLLEAVNGALNEILAAEKLRDMKLMPNSHVDKNRYPNIAILEMMFWAYSNLQKKSVNP